MDTLINEIGEALMDAAMLVVSNRIPSHGRSVIKAPIMYAGVALVVLYVVVILGIGWPLRIGLTAPHTIKCRISGLKRSPLY